MAAFWPDLERTYRFVYAAARVLANPDQEASAQVWRRFDGLLAVTQRHRSDLGDLEPAFAHFCKVDRSYRPGLFHAASVPDLPRTNNALEQLFGSQRYHKRRATGRETASPDAQWPA